MALKAGYIGVKRRIYEKLQAITTKNVQDIAEIIDYEETTGVKNILDVTAATQEKGGLTFTVNADKSITIGAGTSTSAIYFNLDYVNNSDLNSKNISAFVGKKLRGSISPSNVGVGLAIGYFKGDNTYVDRITSDYIYTSGVFEYPSAAVRTKNFLYIANNTTFATDTTIYPMITFEDMSLDFAPFAMTNRQLTKAYEIANKTGVTFDDTYCDVSGCSYSLSVKGNLAQIIGVVKITTQVPQYTKFIDGLPAVKSSGGAAFNFALLSSVDGTKTYMCYLDTYGKISAHVTPIPVGSYVLSFVYFCAEDSGVYTRSLNAASDTREASPEVIEEEPVEVVKKATRTKKTATNTEKG